MKPRALRAGQRALSIEWALGLIVMASVAWAIWYFFDQGRLPQPFFWVVSDTLMDWHNPAYWAHNPGAYDTWRSVYPPLSFVFLKFFSAGQCYVDDPFSGRDCDRWGQAWLVAFWLLNAFLLYKHYRMTEPRTALLRAVILTISLPMLFGMERGNLIIPCFTAFILGHSRLLKSARLRWLAHAFAINFKPYLIITLIPLVTRRRWRRFEAVGIATLLLYLLTLAWMGGGTPMEIIQHTKELAALQDGDRWSDLWYSTSYGSIIRFIESPFPVTYFLGSEPVELAYRWLPILVHIGQLVVVIAVILAWLRPYAVPARWLTGALSAIIISSSQPSGYAQVFMLFFVFMEPWRGPTRIAMLISAYALCFIGDHILYEIPQTVMESWLSNRQVLPVVGIGLGEFVRPLLVLFIQCAFSGLAINAALKSRAPAKLEPVPKLVGVSI